MAVYLWANCLKYSYEPFNAEGIHALECSYLAYQNFILMKEILTKVMKFFLTRVLLLFLVSISNGQTTFGIMDSGKGFCTKSSS